MNFSGIFSGIEHNADKIGMAVAALNQLSAQGSQDPMGFATQIMNGIIQKPHIPDIGKTAALLTNIGGREGQTFLTSIYALIAGWILKEIDVIPQLTRLGNFLEKAGFGGAEAAVVITLLEEAGMLN